MPPTVELFEPADFAIAELHFMLQHLTETPNVALHGTPPPGVNPVAIRKTLGRFSELEELKRVKQVPWAGYDPIKDSIQRFIAFQEKCLQGQAQGEPRHPSQHTWDSTGAMSRGGIGSDSSDKVRSELLPDGTRRSFTVNLTNLTKRQRSMWGPQSAPPVHQDAIMYNDNGTYSCTICQKVVVSFDIDKGSRARNKARADARKHCLKSTKEQARHRAIANVPVV